MEISHPNRPALTVEELEELNKLRSVVERASADGVINKSEREQIMAALGANGKVTFEELELLRTLLNDKVANGDLVLDYGR